MLKSTHRNRLPWRQAMTEIYTLLILLASSATIEARPISEDKACVIATKFYYMKLMGNDIAKAKSLQALDLIYSTLHGKELSYTAPEYYIFAPSNGKGFVIIAGDDRAEQLIAGYSTENRISLPLTSSIQGYLNCYAEYIDALRKGKAEPKPRRETEPIAPLITTTWGQHSPYNYYCPTLNGKKLITGCVSTAVAQIMKYHEWPHHGQGECIAEIHNLDTLYSKVTLGEEYHWEKMRDHYKHSSRTKPNDVARLMRDVGHAVHMEYTPVISSAYSTGALTALVEHFAYQPEARQVYRPQHSDEEWNHLISTELSAKRPIYYSTRSTRFDGHAFIVCGIDEQGLYYANWGWGGNCDGYFDFDAVANNGAPYNYIQSAIINITPKR